MQSIWRNSHVALVRAHFAAIVVSATNGVFVIVVHLQPKGKKHQTFTTPTRSQTLKYSPVTAPYIHFTAHFLCTAITRFNETSSVEWHRSPFSSNCSWLGFSAYQSLHTCKLPRLPPCQRGPAQPFPATIIPRARQIAWARTIHVTSKRENPYINWNPLKNSAAHIEFAVGTTPLRHVWMLNKYFPIK